MTEVPIRDAATLVLIRDPASDCPRVLMGQRGKAAVFMPDKFVFPGGAVDPGDAAVPLAVPLPAACAAALADQSDARVPALAAAAIRELWEETGLALGTAAAWADAPPGWRDFAALGLRPSAEALRFVFRAITPPGRPRRFDARFFLADASALSVDPDDFSRASEELSGLQWIPLDAVRDFPLPFVTEVVLAEVAAALPSLEPPQSVPFFRNDDETSLFLRLNGVRPPIRRGAG
jgi:8-oxo-dGTP pyrophosphatase MutT (NUDIX family)